MVEVIKVEQEQVGLRSFPFLLVLSEAAQQFWCRGRSGGSALVDGGGGGLGTLSCFCGLKAQTQVLIAGIDKLILSWNSQNIQGAA